MSIVPDSWPGEKLLIRIWETVEKAAIGLASPMQIRREGRARAEVRRDELLLDVQVQRDIEEIKSGKKSFEANGHKLLLSTTNKENQEPAPMLPPASTQEFINAAQMLATFSATEKVINLRKIIVLAEEECERLGDQPISDKDVDPDWFTRWRNGAEQVSGEELQSLWARVLAGEAKQPGTYSARTLAFLSTLAKRDAELIATAATAYTGRYLIRHVIDDVAKFAFPPSGVGLLEVIGFNLEHIIQLEELGIIQGAETGYRWALDKNQNPGVTDRLHVGMVCNEKGIVIDSPKPDASVKLSVYLVTAVGREVLSLGKFEANLDYLTALAEEIQRIPNSSPLTVRVGDIQYSDDQKNYTLINTTEFKKPQEP